VDLDVVVAFLFSWVVVLLASILIR